MDAILQVDNLTKQYTDFKLDHVSFSVPKGTIMGLIGENGAGKSTTINAILDLIRKDDGTVTFWGQELSSSNSSKRTLALSLTVSISMKLLHRPKWEKLLVLPTNNGTRICFKTI